MSNRKQKKLLESLVQSSREECNDEEIIETIHFHNNEKSLMIKRGRFTYKSNNKNFNEFLIDSHSDWHKITVSCNTDMSH